MVSAPIHLLNKTIDVKRLSVSAGSAGGVSKSYAAHLSAVAARVQPMSSSESVRYGRESTRRMVRVFVGDIDIIESDQVTYDSRTFNVIEVSDLQEEGAVKRVVCEETL